MKRLNKKKLPKIDKSNLLGFDGFGVARRNFVAYKVVDGDGFYTTVRRRVIRVIIPKGALIYSQYEPGYTQKFRCNRLIPLDDAVSAMLHIMCRTDKIPVLYYRKGKLARPAHKFDTRPMTCASGLHFYGRQLDAEWMK
jgi:hypothetical protein